MGATDPVKAAPGTIRGDLALSMTARTSCTARTPPESAAREIALFFPDLA